MNERPASEFQDIATLRAMARESALGFNSGDLDRLMQFYGPTYVDVNLRNPLQTHAERRAYFAQVLRRGKLRITVQPDEIKIHGDVAFIRGQILLCNEDSATPLQTELRYIEIARRGPDGWKVIWGMDGPIQEYEPAAQTQHP